MTTSERPREPTYTLFNGPGATPGLLAGLDWAATPLGPVDAWSNPLRQAVRLILTSRMPMAIWWAADRITLHNDSYAHLVGNKHPAGLGRPAAEAWAEAWSELGPLADAVMRAGESTFSERLMLLIDRHGYLEETYWTSSFSPIRDEHDDTSLGVLVVASDVTDQVVGARRLETVRQLGTLSAASHGGGLEQACKSAIGVLSANRQAVPFATIHIIDRKTQRARLAASYGIGEGTALNPLPEFDLDLAQSLAAVVESGSKLLVTGLRESSSDLLEPGPLGPALPDAAMLLPIRERNGRGVVAVVTLGVNPYRAVDDVYLAFFQLVTRQLHVAIGDAQAYEVEVQRADALTELDEDRTRFYQNASHELRTPVTLVLGPLRAVLEDPTNLPYQHRQRLLSVQRAALRLRKLVDNMFQFSRVQTDELVPVLEPTDLATLTAELASMFRSVAEQAGLSFVIDVSQVTEPIDVDREMWSEIVSNLLSNAMKFTHEGGIEVQLTPSIDRVVLEVRDTGIGIPPEDQAHVFERFKQVVGQSGRSSEGAGIGLALVRALAQALGGDVSVTGQVGRGSRFRVEIPARTASDQITLDPPNRLGTWSAEPYLAEIDSWSEHLDAEVLRQAAVADRVGRLLLVEDNADMRGYLLRLLADEGWEVEAVGDVESALVARLPDIVVSDVMLPGRSGLDLVRMLRADENTARLPVILLTARFGADAAAEGLAAGADDYVVKPFDPAELLARVRTHHELAQLREIAVHRAESRAENLQLALSTNRRIGVAIGVLMVAERLTHEQAFDRLREASQRSNRKLRDVAEDVILTGQLEDSESRARGKTLAP